MKLFFPLAILMFALTFCGIGDQVKKAIEDSEKSETTSNESGDTETKSDDDVATAKLTSEMEALLEGGDKITWEEQGIEFKVPKGWPKMTVSKMMLNYGTPANGFLIANISSLGSDFPVDTSIKAYFDQAVQKAKDGDYEKVQYTMIDGVKGVEFIESMPEDKSGPRRHQWIGYRDYNDQIQMVNVMVTTEGGKFDDKKDVFNAILYSMTMAKK